MPTGSPVEARYFDDDKVLVRTLRFSEIKSLDGRRIPTVIEVVPADEPEEVTRVIYVEMDFDAKVESSIFTQRGLRKLAKQ